jgi:ThiF family protein
MSRSPLLRPTLLPGLPRIWRDSNTLQLGLDPAGAVLIDLPDPSAARVLDLLDGSRPERVVLADAVEHGVAAADARDLLEVLRETGLVMAAPSLLPSSLAEDARTRLSGEAAALALRQVAELRTARPIDLVSPLHPRPAHPGTDQPGPDQPEHTHQAPNQPTGIKPAGIGPTGIGPAGIGPAGIGPAGIGPTGIGLDTPAQILRRRAAAHVVVAGRGRLGAGIAVALAEAGVGHVHPDQAGAVRRAELSGGPLRAADVGRPRAEAVADAVARAAPHAETHPVRRGAATLIIQLGHDQPVALLAASHARRRQPHLPVAIREGAAVIGPFVPPTGAPCLNCVDLHRRERDSGWPGLSAQFGGAAAEPCGVATILAATAYATAEALAFLDGGAPETMGAAVEIAAAGRFRRRTWPPHPGCDCGRRT